MQPNLSVDCYVNYLPKAQLTQDAGNGWKRKITYTNYITVDVLLIKGKNVTTGEIKNIQICSGIWSKKASFDLVEKLKLLLDRKITKRCGEGILQPLFYRETAEKIINSYIEGLKRAEFSITFETISVKAYSEKHKEYIES